MKGYFAFRSPAKYSALSTRLGRWNMLWQRFPFLKAQFKFYTIIHPKEIHMNKGKFVILRIQFINRPFLSIHKKDFSLSFSHFEYFARCFYVSLTDFVSVTESKHSDVQLRSNWRQITKISIVWAWGPIIDEQSLVRTWICRWALGQLWSHCKIVSSWFCVCMQKCLLKMYP